MPQRWLEHAQRRRHHLAQDARPLASAGDEDLQRREFVERRQRRLAQPLDAVAHRIADQRDLGAIAGLEPLDLGIGGGDRLRLPRQKPVDPPEHRILLVQDRRDPPRTRRQQCRKRRITAEPDHRVRREFLVELLRLPPPRQDRPRGPQQPEHPGQPSRRTAHGSAPRRTGRESRAPRSSVISATPIPRAVSSAASACAGTICPPVPPALEDDVRHFCFFSGSRQPAPRSISRHRASASDRGFAA